MRDYSETPPLQYSPLTSDREKSSTRENTPLGTPILVGFPGARSSGGKSDYLSWHPQKSGLYLDSTLLELDKPLSNLDSDLFFPPFSSSPPLFPSSPVASMASQAAPINISRQTSSSPRGQQASNLTSALQGADGGERHFADQNLNGAEGIHFKSPFHSEFESGGGLQWNGGGTNPISTNNSNQDRARRESLAGSLVGGMSWGGISVGSWVRDDIIMAGTSPFAFNSPSYHSSSYLPKLEANFMRDFSCCGLNLASLHDLLQHYEEAHATKSPPSLQRPAQTGPTSGPDSRAALAAGAAAAVQQQAQLQQQQIHNGSSNQGQSSRASQPTTLAGITPTQANAQLPNLTGGLNNSLMQPVEDLDAVEDMEMDDALGETETTPPPQMFQTSRMQPSNQSSFGQQNPSRVAPLNLMQSQQGLRHSQPTTPVNPGRPGFTNPTVSSVNTPTFATHQLQQQPQAGQYRSTPDSSNPGTPGELDENIVGGMGDMSMYANPLMPQPQGQNFGYAGFGNSDMLDLYIDEPAKRLYSPTGGYNQQQQYAQMTSLGAGSQYTADSQVARRIREQQRIAGVPDTTAGMMPNDEPKPFRCPVIGCEKAYKNQNGLKYHKGHGHNTQQLHDNNDGTFSIVNPETSVPYPGTMGMEKEKPYKCNVCGKRYKNLNGLKYHKAHSPPCVDVSHNPSANPAAGGVMHGQNINIAGAGLPGIGEEGLI